MTNCKNRCDILTQLFQDNDLKLTNLLFIDFVMVNF